MRILKLPETFPLLHKAFGEYRRQIAVLGILGVASSFLAGLGIGAVVPLLSFLIGGEGADATAPGAASYIVRLFDYLPVPFTFQAVLILIIIIFVARAGILMIFNYTGARIRADYKNKTARLLLEKMLQSKWAFFLSKKLGYVDEVLLRDVDTGAKLLESFAHLMLSFISAVVLLIFAFSISPQLTLLSAGAGVLLLWGFRPLVRKSRELGKLASDLAKEAAQFVTEHAIGMKAIKGSAVEGAVLSRGSDLFRQRKALELRKSIIASASSSIIEPASVVFVVAAFAFSYTLENFSFQVFAATIFLIQRVFVYLESGQVSLHIVNETIPRLLHVVEFGEDLTKNQEKNSGGRTFKFNETLVFKDVSLSYAPERAALSGITLEIRRGESIGIVGPSGSGKTSLADLMMRLFEPTAGSIQLDGVPSGEYDILQWRTRVGYVPQDSFLLNDTIEENIRFYRKDLRKEELEEAARRAGILDFIETLPDKFQTITGERGVNLSGGQRQRITLARVLTREPAILILDEATSSLDRESEAVIQSAIRSLRGEITVVIIAHRLSTIRDVDRLLVVDQGRIVEEGRPEELLKNGASYFSRMHQLGPT